MLILATKKVKDIKKIKVLILFLLLISAIKADIRSFLHNKASFTMLDEIKDPFFEQDEQKETKLKLQAILDNKAKINGLWYMQGDYIDDAKIISIKDNKILLQGLSGDFYLDIERKSHKISIN